MLTKATPEGVSRIAAGLLWLAGSAYLIQSQTSHVARPLAEHLEEIDWVAVGTTPLLWGVVIALPILAHHAWDRARYLAFVLLVLAALVGSAFTLHGTISRRAEVREAARIEADASAKPVELLAGEVTDAKAAVADAKARADKACTRNPDSDACEVWTKREKAYRALVTQSIVQLSDATPPKPKASGDKAVTNAVTLAIQLKHPTVTDKQVAPYVAAFGDSLLGFLLEIGALACGFFGWGPSSGREPAVRALPKGSEPFGGKLDEIKPALPAPEPVVMQAPSEIPEDARLVLAAFAGRKGALRNVDLAERMGCVKSEASKRVAVAVQAGVVASEKIGREVFVRPVAIN